MHNVQGVYVLSSNESKYICDPNKAQRSTPDEKVVSRARAAEKVASRAMRRRTKHALMTTALAMDNLLQEPMTNDVWSVKKRTVARKEVGHKSSPFEFSFLFSCRSTA